jgi:hypothetical protein
MISLRRKAGEGAVEILPDAARSQYSPSGMRRNSAKVDWASAKKKRTEEMMGRNRELPLLFKAPLTGKLATCLS